MCLAIAGGLACGDDAATGNAHPPATDPFGAAEAGEADKAPTRASAAALAPLPATTHRGICLAHGYQNGGVDGYGSETSRGTLGELEDLGATWVSLTPFGWMPSLTSTRVQRHTGANGETDDRMVAEIRAARALRLRVMLKPHVWIRGGAFRGHIRPGGVGDGPATDAGWDAFHESHARFVLHYAAMAAAHDVQALVIGVEFDSAVAAHPEAWRALIARVREVYSGELVYAANWDKVADVPFWSELDYVGVQFYPSLADAEGASLARLRRAMAGHLDGLVQLAQDVGRPVVLTEVGYRATADAAVRPHLWPERMAEMAPDPAAQALAYHALLAEVAVRPTIRGLYIWKYFTDPDTDEEGAAGFSPRGRAAENLLRRAFRMRGAARARPAAATP